MFNTTGIIIRNPRNLVLLNNSIKLLNISTNPTNEPKYELNIPVINAWAVGSIGGGTGIKFKNLFDPKVINNVANIKGVDFKKMFFIIKCCVYLFFVINKKNFASIKISNHY